MEVLTLNCSHCGGPVDVHNQLEFRVVCPHCGNTLLLFYNDGKDGSEGKNFVPLPPGFMVEKGVDYLSISLKNRGPKYYILLGFSIFWLIFSVGFATIGSSGARAGIGIIFALFPLLIGLGLFYFGLQGVINTTTILLKAGVLSVSFKPLWWFGAKQLQVNNIVQLYTKQTEYNGKNGTSYTYSLVAVMKNNSSATVLSFLESPEVCKCFEQQIESYLGIKNVKVQGEYEKK